MKSFVLLIALFTLVASLNLRASVDENHGCVIKSTEGRCCWLNNNGCCSPYQEICTDAFRTCCKTKYFDEATQTYKYKYS